MSNKTKSIFLLVTDFLFPDRVNDYSDDDDEFSSAEENYDAADVVGMGGYDPRRELRKYRKLDRNGDHDADEGAMCGRGGGRGVGGGGSGAGGGGVGGHHHGGGGGGGSNPVDSDSEFENLKDKGSRAKISRVGIWLFF